MQLVPNPHDVPHAPHDEELARSAQTLLQQAGAVPVHATLLHVHLPPMQVRPFVHAGVQVLPLPPVQEPLTQL